MILFRLLAAPTELFLCEAVNEAIGLASYQKWKENMQHCNQPTSLPSAINATCISATSQRSPLRTLRTYSRLCCRIGAREGERLELPLRSFPGSLKASRNSSGTISPQVMGLGTPRPVPAVASITRETFRSSVQGGEDRLSQALEPGRGVPVPHPPLGTCGPDLHEAAPPRRPGAPWFPSTHRPALCLVCGISGSCPQRLL